ncbi:MAG TPA: [Fe-S]-binding protein, partial [Acidobacteriota bacterium]|nr:[Fe-S]-binding protein [Acidobacteriota bacterium]
MIPYLVPPEDLVPGEPIYYTSVCGGCTAGCGVLAKCLDGRPVKLEGNPDHPASRGALCALGQASLWELYDSGRALLPRQAGREVPWETLDSCCLKALEEVRR